jgi:hypothetical protein
MGLAPRGDGSRAREGRGRASGHICGGALRQPPLTPPASFRPPPCSASPLGPAVAEPPPPPPRAGRCRRPSTLPRARPPPGRRCLAPGHCRGLPRRAAVSSSLRVARATRLRAARSSSSRSPMAWWRLGFGGETGRGLEERDTGGNWGRRLRKVGVGSGPCPSCVDRGSERPPR